MGSSKKHKEKEKDRDPEDRHREHKKHRHKDRDKEKDREREKRKRSRSRERSSRGAEKDRGGKADRSNAEPRVKKEKPDPAFEDNSGQSSCPQISIVTTTVLICCTAPLSSKCALKWQKYYVKLCDGHPRILSHHGNYLYCCKLCKEL